MDQPPNTYPFTTTCRFCKREIVTYADVDCPNEWRDKLSPLLCCDPCNDYITKRNRSIEHIGLIVQVIAQQKLVRNRDREKCEAAFTRLCKALYVYMDVMATNLGREWAGDVKPLAGSIVEEPWHWRTKLNDFRRTNL